MMVRRRRESLKGKMRRRTLMGFNNKAAPETKGWQMAGFETWAVAAAKTTPEWKLMPSWH
jgi:hypothetical protein